MIKFTILLRRKSDLSHQEFLSKFRAHAQLFIALPDIIKQHIRRYVQTYSTGDQFPGLPQMTFDGAVEFWFDDSNGLSALLASSDYLSTIRPDEESFVDMQHCEFLLATENVVI